MHVLMRLIKPVIHSFFFAIFPRFSFFPFFLAFRPICSNFSSFSSPLLFLGGHIPLAIAIEGTRQRCKQVRAFCGAIWTKNSVSCDNNLHCIHFYYCRRGSDDGRTLAERSAAGCDDEVTRLIFDNRRGPLLLVPIPFPTRWRLPSTSSSSSSSAAAAAAYQAADERVHGLGARGTTGHTQGVSRHAQFQYQQDTRLV